MELRLDELYTYLHCPAQYNFKYGYELELDETESVMYKKALHKTISYFYFQKLGGIVPTARQMRDKWASIWKETKEESESVAEIILKERQYQRGRRTVDKKITQGFEMIHNFYHFNKEKEEIPIAVDHEFRVPIAGVTVIGNFELIRETIDKSSPNRFIEIVDFKTSTRTTDMFLVNNDLYLSIMSYAFRNLFQSKEDRLTYSYLKTGEEIHTSRTEKDFDRMKATIEGVAEGIANKRFYPRQTFMCKDCGFKDACEIVKF